MLHTSGDYDTAVDATNRKPTGKIVVTWTDPYIDPSLTVATTSDNRGTINSQVADNTSDPSFKYTLLDGTWKLNEDYHLGPETVEEKAIYQVGHYCNEISASSSPYTFTIPQSIRIDFPLKTIQGVFLAGDKLLNEYPVDYTIYVRNGAVVLNTIIVTGNGNVENFYSGIYDNVDNIEIVIDSWSAPNTCCKIVEFFNSWVATYYGNDILSIDTLEEREIRDATFPYGNISSNEVSIAIQNYDYGYNEWVATGQVVYVKSDIQDVTTWSVYRIVDGGTPTLFDTYSCPSRIKGAGYFWHFVYGYEIPVYTEGTTIQLYFLPSGTDTGKPGAFYSTLWTIKTIILDPYHPDNPGSIFYNLIKPNRKIVPYIGFILDNGAYEYIKLGTFFSSDWITSDNNIQLSTDARDRLGLLQDHIYDRSVLWENESLYTIANDVLTAAKSYIPMPELQWEIDSTLNGIIIPKAFFERRSYFEVLEIISKACLGQCFMDKEDVLQLNSYNINVNPGSYVTALTKDQYFNVRQSNSYKEIINKVNVTYTQYTLESSTEIYRSSDDIVIAASETLDPITIEYSNPVKGGSATLVDITGGITVIFSDEQYYSWGAILTVQETSGNPGTFKIAIDAQELLESDTFTVSTQDDTSINENTLLEYDLPDNYLIQSETTALLIATNLLSIYKNPRSLIEVDYRGNPAIELQDVIRITIYKRDAVNILKDYILYKSELNFDGTLKGKLYCRCVPDVAPPPTTIYQDSDNGIPLYQDSDTGIPVWQVSD